MKIYNKILFAIALLGATATTQSTYAKSPENPFLRSAAQASRSGGVQGGGGDTATEGRIQDIRRDLVKWISNDGARGIDFSISRNQISYEEYLNGNKTKKLFGMNDILLDGAVVINAIHDHEERMDNDEMNTYIAGYPKTCKGFISKKDGRPHMLCNVERFWDLKPGWTEEQLQSEQYRQVHHEYAALGLLEKNMGSDSDTSISDQITGFLQIEAVLRLAVKSRNSGRMSMGEIPVGSELTLHSDMIIPANAKTISFDSVRSNVYELSDIQCIIQMRKPSPQTRLIKAGRVFSIRSVTFDYRVEYGFGYDRGVTLNVDSDSISDISCVGHRGNNGTNWSLLPSVSDFEKIIIGKFGLKLSQPLIAD